MSILMNPTEDRIPIQLGKGKVILVCEPPTTKELTAFLGARHLFKKGKAIDNSAAEKIRFMKTRVKNIEAYDDAGFPEKLQFQNKEGQIVDFSIDAPNWKKLVPDQWLLSGAAWYEEKQIDEEEETLGDSSDT